MSYDFEFTVADLRAAAGEATFAAAGRHVVDIDGPHEDDWSLYATVRLDDGQQLETILHHRAGKPLQGDCTCGEERAGNLCSHLVWVIRSGLPRSQRGPIMCAGGRDRAGQRPAPMVGHPRPARAHRADHRGRRGKPGVSAATAPA